MPPPTKLQKEFTSYLSIASNVPNAVFVILHALLGHLVGMRLRVLGSQVHADHVLVTKQDHSSSLNFYFRLAR